LHQRVPVRDWRGVCLRTVLLGPRRADGQRDLRRSHPGGQPVDHVQ
jgi:hypothetical protein